jgi:hypothetical protein
LWEASGTPHAFSRTMKTRHLYHSLVASFMLALSSTTLSAVIIDGSAVTVDFDDFYSGTLIGYENNSVDRQLYSSDNVYNPLGAGQGFETYDYQ